MQEYFYTLADAITALLKGDEIYTCTFRGEDSDFVRFNRSAVRQAGTVAQRFLNLDLIRGQRHAAADVALSGDLEEDRARLTQAVAELREQLPYLPEDPVLAVRHGSAVQHARRVKTLSQTARRQLLLCSTPGVAGIWWVFMLPGASMPASPMPLGNGTGSPAIVSTATGVFIIRRIKP